MRADGQKRFRAHERRQHHTVSSTDDDCTFEERLAQVARLAEDVAEQMDTSGAPMDIFALLGRIERASASLREIGQLTLVGAERAMVHELCMNVQVMIGQIHALRDRTGERLGQREDG
jgi:hypothetical protein